METTNPPVKPNPVVTPVPTPTATAAVPAMDNDKLATVLERFMSATDKSPALPNSEIFEAKKDHYIVDNYGNRVRHERGEPVYIDVSPEGN